MPEFTIVSKYPEQEAENIAKLLQSHADGEGGPLSVPLDDCKITLLSEGTYQTRYGALASPMGQRASIFGAMTIRTNDLNAFRVVAKQAGFPTVDNPNSVIVCVPEFDSVVEFVQ